MTSEASLSFETAYARLEEILEKMNSANVALEDSLTLYEEADHLINWCSKRLTEAEKKIEVLVKNRDSELQCNDQGRPHIQAFNINNNAPLNRTDSF